VKFALGTVQFGMDYGISNKNGITCSKEVGLITSRCRELGIDTIDTAISYGGSENILGLVGVTDFKVISKIPPVQLSNEDKKQLVLKNIFKSLDGLRIKKLHGLLLHNAEDLLGADSSALLDGLMMAKELGLVDKIGYSIYSEELLPNLLKILVPDIIQAPLNVFDQRLISSGWLKRLVDHGIEMHTRSVFLQGLLLMSDMDRPDYFKRWHLYFNNFEISRRRLNITAMQQCLGFVKKHKEISRIVVGVNNVQQLNELILAFNSIQSVDCSHLACSELNLIDPSLWRLIDD
jgi:aryl-alcohol dehydrogenase-like predicted oxidoreductase